MFTFKNLSLPWNVYGDSKESSSLVYSKIRKPFRNSELKYTQFKYFN